MPIKASKKVGCSCLLFSKAGLEYLYIKSKFIAIQCTLHRRKSGEKERERSKRECPAGDRSLGIVCGKWSVSKLKTETLRDGGGGNCGQ